MLMLATDLDRTLFPNGVQEYEGSMPRLCRLLEERDDIRLVYVTGRNARETMDGIAEYGAPMPAAAVCEVGTRVYSQSDGKLHPDADWDRLIAERVTGWDTAAFERTLSEIDGLRLQPPERQNPFKRSFFLAEPRPDDPRLTEIRAAIARICRDADVVDSVDETRNQGLVDVLPRAATKVAGLEYLCDKFQISRDDVIYAGDSGNDLLPLTSGCRAILVRNAVEEVRAAALRILDEKGLQDRLYCAHGAHGFNGYYVSGILEGLVHFGILS